MIWFSKTFTIDNCDVELVGTFSDSTIRIDANFLLEEETYHKILYEKTINMWSYQEVMAEDVYRKYRGIINKAEKRIPLLIEKIKIEKRIL